MDKNPTHEIGELCAGAEYACTTGDLETLGHIAHRLAAFAREPLESKLIALAQRCRDDPDRAVADWLRLEEQLREETGHAGIGRARAR